MIRRQGRTMSSWQDFTTSAPALAAQAKKNLYEVGIGLGFLATVRSDGAPRVHPVCPVVSDIGLHVLIVRGPKQRDLRRDGRYALHSETCPPPDHEDGCMLTGHAVEIRDSTIRLAVLEHLARERQTQTLWPTVHDDALFELTIDTCLLMRTTGSDTLPAGPTIWKSP